MLDGARDAQRALRAEGVTDFFGLMGDGNMWLWGALCRDSAVKPYNARHESMAVSMADYKSHHFVIRAPMADRLSPAPVLVLAFFL